MEYLLFGMYPGIGAAAGHALNRLAQYYLQGTVYFGLHRMSIGLQLPAMIGAAAVAYVKKTTQDQAQFS